MRALIVDDSKPVRIVLRRMLEGLGFETTEASNGWEALEKLSGDARFDLALLDWNMPVMTGIELLRTVRARPELGGMKVVMVTTETEVEQVQRAMDAGASEYLMKPFTREGLLAKLELIGSVPVP